MRRPQPIVAAAAAVVALAAVVPLGACRRPPVAAAPAAPAAALQATPLPGRLVLFFPGDDALLHREAREVPELPAGALPRMRLVMEELLAGSREGLPPAFPWPGSVQAVFLDRAGNAYVDLSPPPSDSPAGTEIETTIAYATVNSLVANCPGVQRVQLLFGGKEIATLGHLDLSRPLAPNLELVAP